MRRRRRPDPPPLTPLQRQRLDGWLTCLDDPELIDTAQSVLRLPPAAWPVPPIALPAVLDTDGVTVLASAVEPPEPGEPIMSAAPSVALRGAYARRAAARG